MDVKLPDGTVVQNVPDGMSKADLVTKLKANGMNVPDAWSASAAPKKSAVDTLLDTAKNTAGAIFEPAAQAVTGAIAKPLSDVAGLVGNAANAVGLTDSTGADAQAATRKMFTYQPQTAAGQAGSQIVGKLGQATVGAPTQALGQAAGQGASALGASPDVSQGVQNGVTEAGQQGIGLLGLKAPAGGAARLANTAEDAALAAPKADAVNAAHAAGYPMAPSEGSSAIPGVHTLAGIGGKNDINSLLTLAAQKNTQRIAAQDLGVPPTTPLKPSLLDTLEDAAGQKYDAIRSADQNVVPKMDPATGQPVLSSTGKPMYQKAGPAAPDADYTQAVQDIGSNLDSNVKSAASDEIAKVKAQLANPGNTTPSAWLSTLKQLRADAKAYRADSGPVAQGAAEAYDQAQSAVSGLLQRYLKNQPDLYTDFTAARQQIAKIKDYRDAMNPATGAIDAAALANLPSRGAMTGGAKTIADAADALPNYVKNSDKTQAPAPISAFGWNVVSPSIATGFAGHAAAGNAGLAAGLAPLGVLAARSAARNAVMSGPVQASLSARIPQAGALSTLAANPASPLAGLAVPASTNNGR
jgi:hypothetical protein